MDSPVTPVTPDAAPVESAAFDAHFHKEHSEELKVDRAKKDEKRWKEHKEREELEFQLAKKREELEEHDELEVQHAKKREKLAKEHEDLRVRLWNKHEEYRKRLGVADSNLEREDNELTGDCDVLLNALVQKINELFEQQLEAGVSHPQST